MPAEDRRSPDSAERVDALWPALVAESIGVREAMRDALRDPLEQACDLLLAALRSGGKVILLGNGGSGADAQHVAAEIVGRFRLERRGWPALALSENVASLTGIANDYGFESVFVRQLEAFAADGDVVIALSTSGRSPNVVAALDYAGELGLARVAITGPDLSPAGDRAEVTVRVPAPTTAAVQEGYLLFLHALCHVVEETLTRE